MNSLNEVEKLIDSLPKDLNKSEFVLNAGVFFEDAIKSIGSVRYKSLLIHINKNVEDKFLFVTSIEDQIKHFEYMRDSRDPMFSQIQKDYLKFLKSNRTH